MNTVMGCLPVSSTLITMHQRVVPFNITVIQAYAQRSDYDDNEIEEIYNQLQNVIEDGYSCCAKRLKCKSGQNACENGQGICGPLCNDNTNERGLMDFWRLPPLTFLCRRTLLIITKRPEDGHGIAQMDNTTTRLITV